MSPNAARITTLSSWSQFFSAQGQFRLPSTEGASVEHLDIDLRFIDHDSHDGLSLNDVYLPNVAKLTLRGAEFCQDDDYRMDCLAEVFNAISPVEVQWVNAYDHADEQQTLSTVMVHPAITVAGEIWRSRGTLRKLVIQGGFPVPNLTAPTPFVLTPAASPCPSPGPNYGAFPGFATGLPNLSLTKPRTKEDKDKLSAAAGKVSREERMRLADYSLKPRFEWAFGSWGVEHVSWSFEGRYSAAAAKTTLTRLFEALATTYPSSTHKAFIDPPSLFSFQHLPAGLTLEDLQVPEQIQEYIADVAFIDAARAFEAGVERVEREKDKDRAARRFKADMLLLQSRPKAVATAPAPESPFDDEEGMGGSSTEDEVEAFTPPLGSSFHSNIQLDAGAAERAIKNRKGSQVHNGEQEVMEV